MKTDKELILMGLQQEINTVKFNIRDNIFERKLEDSKDCENLIILIKQLQDLIDKKNQLTK